MSQYKCENHTLIISCPGCIRAWMARHDKMLQLLRKIISSPNMNWDIEAIELLTEIGKLE